MAKEPQEKTPGPGHNKPPVDQAWLNKQLGELRKLGNSLLDNKRLKEVAGKTRATWISYGAILADVREVITSNKDFNAWLKENDLEAYADRNSRTDAMWLSKQSEDLISLVPAELHSPKAIRNWYRKSMKEALEENDGNVEAAMNNPDTADFANAVNAGDWDVAVANYEASKDREKFEEMTAKNAAAEILKKIAKHSTPYDVFEALRVMVEEGALDEEAEGEGEPTTDGEPNPRGVDPDDETLPEDDFEGDDDEEWVNEKDGWEHDEDEEED